jgi:hypothetical protein
MLNRETVNPYFGKRRRRLKKWLFKCCPDTPATAWEIHHIYHQEPRRYNYCLTYGQVRGLLDSWGRQGFLETSRVETRSALGEVYMVKSYWKVPET